MNYTEQQQDEALKVLSNLVKENQDLKKELNKCKQFALRILSGNNIIKNDYGLFFEDNGVIEFTEDWDKILEHFFIDFNNNSNTNKSEEGMYTSSLSVRLKNGTPFPNICLSKDILTEIKNIEKYSR